MKSNAASKENFPFAGELFPARTKKYKELIFFVHFYDGSKKQLLRHIRFVNSLGFDAFAFDLQGTFKDLASFKPPISLNSTIGLKHIYADQIEALLNLLPTEKIIFSFSNPSASAIEAMARRNCTDIQALICDSGPSHRFLRSAVSLFQQEYFPAFKPLGYLVAPLLSWGWSPYLHKDLKAHLDQLPKNFPVLSVQGGKDLLIPADDIDEVFEGHSNLNWKKLVLPLAGHLVGLHDFKEIYTAHIEKFLTEVATPL